MSVTPTSGDWREERLYVLKTIEDLKAEQRRLSEAAAIAHEVVEKKAQHDIREAHDKIRVSEGKIKTLQDDRVMLRLKVWIMTVTLSAGAAVLYELAKAFLHGWRP